MQHLSWLRKGLALVCLVTATALSTSAAPPRNLADYQAIYKKQLAAIESKHAADIDAVMGRYRQDLERQLATAKRAGDLDAYKRIKLTQTTIAADQLLPPAFVEQQTKVDTERNVAIVALTKKYIGALTQLKASLMQQNSMRSAAVVDKEVKRVDFIAADLEMNMPVSKEVRLREGLVLHYDFSRRESDQVTDRSDARNHAQNNGAKWVASSRGRSGVMRFERGSSVDVGKAMLTDGDWTLTAYIKKDDGSSGAVLSQSIPNSLDQFSITYDAGSRIWRCGQGPSPAGMLGPLRQGEWMSLAVIKQEGTLSVYVDGAPVNLRDTVISPLPQAPFTLAGEKQFVGDLDDIMIWHRALSANEIKQLGAEQKGRAVTSRPTRAPLKLSKPSSLRGSGRQVRGLGD